MEWTSDLKWIVSIIAILSTIGVVIWRGEKWVGKVASILTAHGEKLSEHSKM